MPEVYGTDWFERWFRALSEAEQEDIIAVVDLLEQKGWDWAIPTALRFTDRSTAGCGSCELEG